MRAMIVARDWSKSVECSRQPISLLFSVRWPNRLRRSTSRNTILPRPILQLLCDLFQGTLRFRSHYFENKIFENKITDSYLLRPKAICRSNNLGAAD